MTHITATEAVFITYKTFHILVSTLLCEKKNSAQGMGRVNPITEPQGSKNGLSTVGVGITFRIKSLFAGPKVGFCGLNRHRGRLTGGIANDILNEVLLQV